MKKVWKLIVCTSYMFLFDCLVDCFKSFHFSSIKSCDLIKRKNFQIEKSFFVLPHFHSHITGAAEYTDYINTEGQDSLNKCPGYDTKQSDGKAGYPFIAQSGST